MIDTEPRPSRLFVPNPPWRVGTVILGMGYTIFVIIVLIAIVGAFLVGLDIDDGTPAEINLSLIAQTAANLAILSGIFWFVRRRGAGPDDFGIRPWDYGRWWWIVVAFVIASYATLGGYALLIEQLDIEALEPESNVPDEIKDSAITLVLAAFFSILIAPVTEELFFRGFLLGGVKQSYGLAVGVMASSLLFGLVHGQLGLLIPFAVIGGYLALAYLYTHSIWGSVACHLTFNTLSVIGLALS
jgi:CAAX protease family protein